MRLYEIAVRLIPTDRSVRPRRCAPPAELDGRIGVAPLAVRIAMNPGAGVATVVRPS